LKFTTLSRIINYRILKMKSFKYLYALFIALFLCMGLANANQYVHCKFAKELFSADGAKYCYNGTFWWTAVVDSRGTHTYNSSFRSYGISATLESVSGVDNKGHTVWTASGSGKNWYVSSTTYGLGNDATCEITNNPKTGYAYTTKSMDDYKKAYDISKDIQQQQRAIEAKAKKNGSTAGLNVPGLPTPGGTPNASSNHSPKSSHNSDGSSSSTEDTMEDLPQGAYGADGFVDNDKGSCSVS
jgi:hypothetical protein